jgi:hypothetical protein
MQSRLSDRNQEAYRFYLRALTGQEIMQTRVHIRNGRKSALAMGRFLLPGWSASLAEGRFHVQQARRRTISRTTGQ